jgi:hypothetical protein
MLLSYYFLGFPGSKKAGFVFFFILEVLDFDRPVFIGLSWPTQTSKVVTSGDNS